MNGANAESMCYSCMHGRSLCHVLCCRLLPSLSGFHSQALGTTDFLEKHWVQINVEPLSRQELVQIVDTKVCSLNC